MKRVTRVQRSKGLHRHRHAHTLTNRPNAPHKLCWVWVWSSAMTQLTIGKWPTSPARALFTLSICSFFPVAAAQSSLLPPHWMTSLFCLLDTLTVCLGMWGWTEQVWPECECVKDWEEEAVLLFSLDIFMCRHVKSRALSLIQSLTCSNGFSYWCAVCDCPVFGVIMLISTQAYHLM